MANKYWFVEKFQSYFPNHLGEPVILWPKIFENWEIDFINVYENN